jgi:phage shock protein A
MSILGRFSNLIKSNLNAAVDKLSDPAKEVDLLITEMEDELKKLRLELRDQLAREKLAQKKVDEEYRAVQKWQEHAERAVQAGDDELAKEALRRRDEMEVKLAAVEKTFAEHSQLTAKLAAQLKAGDQKLVEVKGKREPLKARARAAKQAANPDGTAFDRFNTLVSQIESQEEQAQAMAELLPELHPAVQDDKDRQTSERFDRLLGTGPGAGVGAGAGTLRSEKDQELDARLAALKAKLDKRPSGE